MATLLPHCFYRGSYTPKNRMQHTIEPYHPVNSIRIVTATSLFDGHDASINVMRRILQSTGAEIIHLGHNRSALEIVNCAIQEDVQAIAITSYQGGHIEFFKYVYDLLGERGYGHVRIFGGGGGTILPTEIEELQNYGIERLYSPDDGRKMGLQGMINDLIARSDFPVARLKNANKIAQKLSIAGEGEDVLEEEIHIENDLDSLLSDLKPNAWGHIGRLISICENDSESAKHIRTTLGPRKAEVPILGITGTGGAGKSSLIDELALRYVQHYPDKTLAIISIDPSRRRSGGALLGDRIRMNAIHNPNIYMRSMATRQSNLSLSTHVKDAILIAQSAGFDLVLVETSGIGQSDTQILDHSDVSLYVMTPEYGAATQLEKIDMLDFADVIAINKFDKKGSLDALRDVRKQFRRNRNFWDGDDAELPVVGTQASQFNDEGMNELFRRLFATVASKTGKSYGSLDFVQVDQEKSIIIPADRTNYLAEIADLNRMYGEFVEQQAGLASQLYKLVGIIAQLEATKATLANSEAIEITLTELRNQYSTIEGKMDGESRMVVKNWKHLQEKYTKDNFEYKVRDKIFSQPLTSTTLSGSKIPKVVLPKYSDWGDVLRWRFTENVPGKFPYAAGVFPLKREGEDPTRMFAGEGNAERTNRRFHYVSRGLPAKRLSTAFDSVTLYGQDPDYRPDIYGKIGNSGVSISTLDDAKKLYSGFDLCSPSTSVSMTINGPAPMVLAFFLNAAIDQQCELYLEKEGKLEEAQKKIQEKYKALGVPVPAYEGELPEGNNGLGLALIGATGDEVLDAETYARIKADTLKKVRGTVQADILKEDQAQNTCIFSTDFALRMMGDIQEYFIEKNVTNFYSVSISGYHIAEAGANPITQLALTLANGFTYVEYYLSRGMKIDDFAPNLSFFFSNGVDTEYAVIGRVARRIWAKAMKHRYKGNERSQKLKYHIQTSGRSLHAQEIAFNDIRTTLQALYAIMDNCNSLHTNAYDEAITTPTEESVRRAMAIQLIINHELGLTMNENPLQGSFLIEELSDMVEQAVLKEFKAISERGGVLGAMERMYQRNKIQDESMYYEGKKHDGSLKLIGVNTFLDSKGSPIVVPEEVIRASEAEKEWSIQGNIGTKKRNETVRKPSIDALKLVSLRGGNIFAELMDTVKTCTLGEISEALYHVGGQYRRNM